MALEKFRFGGKKLKNGFRNNPFECVNDVNFHTSCVTLTMSKTLNFTLSIFIN